MREENGIRYYEEGEKVMTYLDWCDELTCSANAIAYDIDPYKGLVSVMAEAVTEKDNDRLEDLLLLYDKTRRVILNGDYTPPGCMLLL